MTTKHYYLPIEQSLISQSFSDSLKVGKLIRKPKAYIEWYDENSTLYLMTTCTSFTVEYTEGQAIATFSAVCTGAQDINPRNPNYLGVLDIDIRKRAVIYYGEYNSTTDTYTYTKIFTGIPTEMSERYSYGEAQISISGQSIGALLQRLDLTPYTTIGFTTLTYNGISSDDDMQVGSHCFQNGSDWTGTIYSHNTVTDVISFKGVQGTLKVVGGGSIYVRGDNTQRIDGLFTNVTDGSDVISGNSKDIIKWICDIAGISYSLTYTDTVELWENEFSYSTGLEGINALKEILGPDVELYTDANGVLKMSDVPDKPQDEVPIFDYTSSNIIELERYTDSSKIVTVANVTGRYFIKIEYDYIDGVIDIGDRMRQWNTDAEGTLAAHDQAGDPDFIVLKNVTGDFDDVNAVDELDANGESTDDWIEPITDGVSTIEIEGALRAEWTMLTKYGEVTQSINSGLITTQDQADALAYDLIKHGRRFVNMGKILSYLNPYLNCGSFITIYDNALSNTLSVNVRLKKVAHSYEYGSTNTTAIEGYMNESSSSSCKSSSSSESSSSSSSSRSSSSSSSSSRSSSSSSESSSSSTTS